MVIFVKKIKLIACDLDGTLLNSKKEITKENIIVGIYQQSLTKNGEYQALMGMEFI